MSEPILYAIPFFLATLAIEAIVTTRRRLETIEARDSAASISMGLGYLGINVFWKGVAFSIYVAVSQLALFDLGTGVAVWIALIFAEDLCYYWFHRVHHEVRFFWASHVVHHSSERYNLATALRQTWTPMTSIVFYLPLLLVGFEPWMVMLAHSWNLLYQYWVHTQLIDRMPAAFEWFFNTPSHHRVHHGANVEYLDRNYAGIFILWDRLFGSFEPERAPVRYGLTKNIHTYNPVRIAFHEFAAIARDLARAPDVRAALGYLFMPPGWSPDGSTLTARQMQRAGMREVPGAEPAAVTARAA